jgi:hypothetical protein
VKQRVTYAKGVRKADATAPTLTAQNILDEEHIPGDLVATAELLCGLATQQNFEAERLGQGDCTEQCIETEAGFTEVPYGFHEVSTGVDFRLL